YDDSYNANPVSVAAAIDFLADCPGETWLVLGDMAELGPRGPELHRAIGGRARRAGITRLFAFGDGAREAAGEFGAGAIAFQALDALTAAIRDAARPGVTALVKGSRCMGLDRLVAVVRDDARDPREKGAR
ncbi:MAG: glutamate ligase domain-containing protein, partial [Gammaproteobacteria bacterium]